MASIPCTYVDILASSTAAVPPPPSACRLPACGSLPPHPHKPSSRGTPSDTQSAFGHTEALPSDMTGIKDSFSPHPHRQV